MKTTRLSMIALSAILFTTACKQSHQDLITTNENTVSTATAPIQEEGGTASKQKPHNGVCNPYAYTVSLESRTEIGSNWEWVWSVQNPNPGNGGNGTVQDLSHWGMQFGTCFNPATIVSAAYSADGNSWTGFTPAIQVDPSQGCMTTPVLKFNYGTNNSNKSYYKVVVNANYAVQMVPAYYKSGANTGCCTFQFEGIGCAEDGETK